MGSSRERQRHQQGSLAVGTYDAAVVRGPYDAKGARFIETSTSWLLGTQQHERSVTDSTGEFTVLTDRLTSEPRGKWVDAFNKASVSATFHMRHRRLRRHFNTHE